MEKKRAQLVAAAIGTICYVSPAALADPINVTNAVPWAHPYAFMFALAASAIAYVVLTTEGMW